MNSEQEASTSSSFSDTFDTNQYSIQTGTDDHVEKKRKDGPTDNEESCQSDENSITKHEAKPTYRKKKKPSPPEEYIDDENAVIPQMEQDQTSPAKISKKTESKSELKKNKGEFKKKKDDQNPKGQLTLAKFFGSGQKKEAATKSPLKPLLSSADIKPWTPFHTKEHMFIASYNLFDNAVQTGFREMLFQDDYEVTKATLKTLKPPQKVVITLPNQATTVSTIFDTINTSSQDDPMLKIRHLPWKLLQFDENSRPAYWGTWSKITKAVSGRHPFGKAEMLDYEYDSEAEWEPDEEGEECCSDDEEEDDAMETASQGSEEGWLVPDGHFSDDEGENLQPQPLSVPAEPRKRTFEPLVPVLVGLYFEEPGAEGCTLQLKECQYFSLNEPFPIDPFAPDPLGADDFLEDPFNNKKSKGKVLVTEDCLKTIACTIHGNGQKLPIQIASIQNKHAELKLTKIAIESKIKEIADRERRGRDNKPKYYVRPEFEYLLTGMTMTEPQPDVDGIESMIAETPEQELARRLKYADTNPTACVNSIFRIMKGGELPLVEFKMSQEFMLVASKSKNAKLREMCMLLLRLYFETLDVSLKKCRAHRESEFVKEEFRKPWEDLTKDEHFLNCLGENLANNAVGFRRVVVETCKLLHVLLGTKDPACEASTAELKKRMATTWLQYFSTGLAHFPWSAVSTECLTLLQCIAAEATLDASSNLAIVLLGQMDNIPASSKKFVYEIFKAFLKNHSKLSHLDDSTVKQIRGLLEKSI